MEAHEAICGSSLILQHFFQLSCKKNSGRGPVNQVVKIVMSIISAKILKIFKGSYFWAGDHLSVSFPFLPYILCWGKAGARGAVFPAIGYETESVRGVTV